MQCNGQCPCNTCGKRNLSCTFGPSEPGSADDLSLSPSKRRLTENDVSGFGDTPKRNDGSPPLRSPPGQLSPQSHRASGPGQWVHPAETSDYRNGLKTEVYQPDVEAPSIESAARSIELFPPKAEEKPEASLISRGTTASGVDEVADNHTLTRMLQDPTGRLCWLPFLFLWLLVNRPILHLTGFQLMPRTEISV